MYRTNRLGFALGIILIAMLSDPAHAQLNKRTDGLKFGLFDFAHPAFGAAFDLGNLTPHLRFNFDADVVLRNRPLAMFDVSLRYRFPAQRRAQAYFGGGAGLAIGKNSSVPAHLVAGFDFRIDTLTAFLELKLHLTDPDAITPWFGIHY